MVRARGVARWWSILAFLLVVVLGAGCARVAPVGIRPFGNPRLVARDSAGWLFEQRVLADNPNGRAVALTRVDLRVWLQETELGRLHLAGPVRVEPHWSGEVRVPLRLEFRSRADEFRLVVSGLLGGLEGMEVEGSVRGRYGGLCRRVSVPRQSLESALRMLGEGL